MNQAKTVKSIFSLFALVALVLAAGCGSKVLYLKDHNAGFVGKKVFVAEELDVRGSAATDENCLGLEEPFRAAVIDYLKEVGFVIVQSDKEPRDIIITVSADVERKTESMSSETVVIKDGAGIQEVYGENAARGQMNVQNYTFHARMAFLKETDKIVESLQIHQITPGCRDFVPTVARRLVNELVRQSNDL